MSSLDQLKQHIRQRERENHERLQAIMIDSGSPSSTSIIAAGDGALPAVPGITSAKDAVKLLDYLSSLELAIEHAYDIADTLKLQKSAQAINVLTRKLKFDRAICNRVAESCIRSEVKLGRMIAALDTQQGARTDLTSFHDGTKLGQLESRGIKPTQAHRWEVMSRVPDDKLKLFINRTNEDGYELTSGGFYSYARHYVKGDGSGGDPPLGRPDFIVRGEVDDALQTIHTLLVGDEHDDPGGRYIVKIWRVED